MGEDKITMLRDIWQFPQHLLAQAILASFKRKDGIVGEDAYEHTIVFWIQRPGWGVSLGDYIFLDTAYNQRTVKHEYGHSRQSLIFGPLYLLVIGLPSVTMNILTRLGVLKSENYYKRWPENWADSLGGVER